MRGQTGGGHPPPGGWGGEGENRRPGQPAPTTSPDAWGMRVGRNATPPSPRVALRGSRAGEGGRAEPCAVGCRGVALATFVSTSEGENPHNTSWGQPALTPIPTPIPNIQPRHPDGNRPRLKPPAPSTGLGGLQTARACPPSTRRKKPLILAGRSLQHARSFSFSA